MTVTEDTRDGFGQRQVSEDPSLQGFVRVNVEVSSRNKRRDKGTSSSSAEPDSRRGPKKNLGSSKVSAEVTLDPLCPETTI